jgi:5-methylcytosine-specific restriction endonuclease McrA
MTYNDKSNDSFNARLRFYLFYCVLANKTVNQTGFLEFDIDDFPSLKYVDLYTTEYQQFNRRHVVEVDGNSLTNDKVYSEIKKLAEVHKSETDSWKSIYREEVFTKKLTPSEFTTFEKVEECGYCKITISEIDELATDKKLFKKNERGFNLELDRKSPNKEYSYNNCIMACYWCNNAKTDEFTAEEFAPIGEAIGEALRNRLKR